MRRHFHGNLPCAFSSLDMPVNPLQPVEATMQTHFLFLHLRCDGGDHKGKTS